MSLFPQLRFPWQSPVRELREEAARLRAFPHGVIEVCDGRFEAVHLRRLPKFFGPAEAAAMFCESLGWVRGGRGDRCLLYYNQCLGQPQYLALKYIVTQLGTRFDTFRAALMVLDEIARLRGIDAIVTDVANARISERLLARWGWERHVPGSRRRHYIKRFYGTYPPAEAVERFLP